MGPRYLGGSAHVVVTIAEARNISLVREVLLAHAFWRLRGFRADLVILNQEAPGYDQPLRQQLLRQIEAHSSEAGMDKPGGIFVRDWYTLPEDSRNLLLCRRVIVLSANRGPLQQQLAAAPKSLPRPIVCSPPARRRKNPPRRCLFSNCLISTDWEDSPPMGANTPSI